MTDRPEGRREGAIITCHPGRQHVHLGGVGLQHAVQLLFGLRVGCKVDRSVARQDVETLLVRGEARASDSSARTPLKDGWGSDEAEAVPTARRAAASASGCLLRDLKSRLPTRFNI